MGHHFAHPGNRFWKVLQAAGFTEGVFSPFEERELLSLGIGITNLVEWATASAADLGLGELREGARRLQRKVLDYHPKFVAFVGMQAYRAAFQRPKATIGPQDERLSGARVWLLPNPSGLQAHYQSAELTAACRELREALAGPFTD